jgi:nucleoid-associated protein YgaU
VSFFKKDDPKKKADFSNVSGGSSTRPAPQTPRSPVPGPGTAAKAGAKPDFSNVRSGGSSTAPVIEPVRGEAGATSYVVRSGDSLSKIAKRVYGDAKQWRRIYDANRTLIGNDPDLIHPGQNLVIPQD